MIACVSIFYDEKNCFASLAQELFVVKIEEGSIAPLFYFFDKNWNRPRNQSLWD